VRPTRLAPGEIKQLGVLVARDHPQVGCQHIKQRGRIAGEAVQADQDALKRDLDLFGIPGEDCEHTQEFATVIAIACATKGLVISGI